LVVKGDMARCEGLENSSNVLLGSTGNANPQTWLRTDEVFHQIQNLFAWGWNTRSIWTFIYSIDDDICWGLPLDVQYTLQTFDKCRFTWLIGTVTVSGVQLREKGPRMVGLIAELREDRRE